jgi:hypothetical protein
VCTGLQEAVFTQNLVEELIGQKKPAIIYEDNLGTIFLVKNQQVSSRTKHIDIRHKPSTSTTSTWYMASTYKKQVGLQRTDQGD